MIFGQCNAQQAVHFDDDTDDDDDDEDNEDDEDDDHDNWPQSSHCNAQQALC